MEKYFVQARSRLFWKILSHANAEPKRWFCRRVKFLLNFLNVQHFAVMSIHKSVMKIYLLQNVMKILIRCESPFFKNIIYLALLENNTSTVFEATTYFAFSLQ